MVIEFCNTCIIPTSRPGTTLGPDGSCYACIRAREGSHDTEISTKYDDAELQRVVASRVDKSADNRICVVPVSGGKDSIYQVQKALDLGLTVVAVNAVPLIETSLRSANIEVIKSLGCDLVEYSGNREWRVETSRIALESVGIPNWSQHLLSVTVPFRFAIDNGIQLVLWGENPEYEYGGPQELVSSTEMDHAWFQARGGLGSLSVSAMESLSNIPLTANRLWRFPNPSEILSSNTAALYLGMFEDWNGIRNLSVAQSLGFKASPSPLPGSLFNYENLDDAMYLIHDFLKYVKFGFGRCSDQASILIRDGILARDEAWRIANRLEGFWPTEYLGVHLHEILQVLRVSEEEFRTICGRLADKRLFVVDGQGRLACEDDGKISLTKEFRRQVRSEFGMSI